jgi:N-acetylmuramoyl-L-alanine amidase
VSGKVFSQLRVTVALLATLAAGAAESARAQAQAETRAPDDSPVVVVDAGHGGDDLGAVGPGGVLEKNISLSVAREVSAALRDVGVQVVLTRDSDRFVPLAERTSVANRARGSFCLSIHANSSPNPEARGVETYFLSVEASDADALQVAITENDVFKQPSSSASADMVGAILGDLAVADTMRLSRKFAVALHRELSKLPGPSRGVKQAEFVVLSGVNMPSALLELGFLTNAEEERMLASKAHHRAIALAVVRALVPLLRSEEVSQRLGPPRNAAQPALASPDKLSGQADP